MNKTLKTRINNFLKNYAEVQATFHGLEKLNSIICGYIFTEKEQKIDKYAMKDACETLDRLSDAFKHDLKAFYPIMASIS